MSTAVSPRPRTDASSEHATDVLVVFGITGDLARVMTFRSLYRLERRGLLDCPIVGVAADDWTIDDLRKHARAAIAATGETIDEEMFDALRRAALLRLRRLRRRRHVRARRGRARQASSARSSTSRSRRRCSGRSSAGWPTPGSPSTRASSSRSRSATTSRRRARCAPSCTVTSTSRSCYRIDHFLGKMGLAEILYLRFANTMLEPVWNRNHVVERADHDGRGLRRRGPRPLLRPGRRAARRRRQPPDAGGRGDRDGAAGGGRPAHAQGRDRAPCCAPCRAADPAHYVRGQYDGLPSTSTASRPDSTTETYAALRLEIDNWRWAGVPFFIRTGKRLPHDPDRGAPGLPAPAAARVRPRRDARRPSPTSSSIKLDPSTGVRLVARRPARRRARARSRSTLDMEFADEGGEAADALRGAAPRRDARATRMRFTRQDAVEEAWRIMQPLLDAPPPVQPYAQGTWGPDAARDARRRPRPLARPVGGVMTAVDGARAVPAAEPQSAAAPSPFPPIADYALPLELPHRRARRARRRRSTGCACRASTRPACSATLLDRQAGYFRLGAVRDQRAGVARLRAGHEHARHDLAHADRLGRSSATR